MSDFHPLAREDALREIPDSPTTIELRACAGNPQAARYRSGTGLLLVCPIDRIVGARGDVRASDVAAVYELHGIDYELVADGAAYRNLRDAYRFERAIVQTLARPWRTRPHQVAGLTIRGLRPADSLAHLPGDLREEIEAQRPLRMVIAGFVDGKAVSFAYDSQTETLADISIDTLSEYQNRGIGTAVASALVDHIVERGKAPVWGALESNAASLRLAAKLGFTQVAGELWVCE